MPLPARHPSTDRTDYGPAALLATVGGVEPRDRARAGTNLRAALSLFARHAPGAVLEERDGVLLIASAAAVTGPFHAAAVRVQPDRDAGQVLAAASRLARTVRRDVIVWGAEDTDADLVGALVAAGLREDPAAVGMSCRLPAVGATTPPEPDGVEVRRVATAADVVAFTEVHRCSIVAAGRAPESVAHFATEGALADPAVDAFVASEGGVAVAAAMAVSTGSVAGIYWVVTHPDHRHRGLGRAVTTAAARAGGDRGADLVVLQATALGEPLYRRLGLVPFTRYRRLRVPWS